MFNIETYIILLIFSRRAGNSRINVMYGFLVWNLLAILYLAWNRFSVNKNIPIQSGYAYA